MRSCNVVSSIQQNITDSPTRTYIYTSQATLWMNGGPLQLLLRQPSQVVSSTLDAKRFSKGKDHHEKLTGIVNHQIFFVVVPQLFFLSQCHAHRPGKKTGKEYSKKISEKKVNNIYVNALEDRNTKVKRRRTNQKKKHLER